MGRRLTAVDATIERRREAEQRKHSDLQTKQRLVGRRVFVERRKKTHGYFEHGGLGFVLGDSLSNDSHRCASGSNRIQAPKNLVKRLVDRDLLQVRELAAAHSKMSLHQNVGL